MLDLLRDCLDLFFVKGSFLAGELDFFLLVVLDLDLEGALDLLLDLFDSKLAGLAEGELGLDGATLGRGFGGRLTHDGGTFLLNPLFKYFEISQK